MLNRKIPPPIHPITQLSLPRPEQRLLSNGIPVFLLNFPKTEILRLEVVFRVGRPEETKRLVSRATARLLRDGTARRTAAEIAEHIDFFGGTFATPPGVDTSSFLLLSQKKYLPELLPVFAEALQEPIFPETELQNFQRTGIADLTVELEKPEVVAYRKITELIFGESHPYGYNSEQADYEALTSNDLRQFFEKWYTPANCQIFIAGNIGEAEIESLDQFFGKNKRVGSVGVTLSHPDTPAKPAKLKIPHRDSMQKAIKIGRQLFTKQHPDFAGVFVLNTILGGYFGSRLMTNIREKRGYTYNIYSSADTMLQDGCLYIASEVNAAAAPKALREIYKELKKLREQPVPDDELAMVKNYLLGTLLTSLDGAMNISEVVRGMVVEGISHEDFDRFVQTILNITPAKIQHLAQKYLQEKDFWEVVVG